MFQAIILNRMLLTIIWYFFHNYFWPRPWPQPPEIGLGLGLVALASASVSRFWPRLTSLAYCRHELQPADVISQVLYPLSSTHNALSCSRPQLEPDQPDRPM